MLTIRIADQDIPVTVTHWQPATPHNLSGHPDLWHEGDAGELEYSVDCSIASAFIEHFNLYDYFDGMVIAAILSKRDE